MRRAGEAVLGIKMKLPFGVIEAIQVCHSRKTGDWCKLPYPGHAKGCPNYGRDGCPPDAPFISDIMDLRRPVYVAFSEFNLSAHIFRMQIKHPNWSDRQCRCVLYWQGTSRKQMRIRVKIAKFFGGGNLVLECPEAHGVNVYATCAYSGLKLQRIKNLETCRHVALIGFRA